MGKETIMKYMEMFLRDVKKIYGATYLNRRPTRAEMGCIDNGYADPGFTGCIGCVDGTKIVWKTVLSS